jgi:hypothetical protein
MRSLGPDHLYVFFFALIALALSRQTLLFLDTGTCVRDERGGGLVARQKVWGIWLGSCLELRIFTSRLVDPPQLALCLLVWAP